MTARKLLCAIGINGLPVHYGGRDKLLDNFTMILSSYYKIVVYKSSHEALSNMTLQNGYWLISKHLINNMKQL
jgi:hypothetical protein